MKKLARLTALLLTGALLLVLTACGAETEQQAKKRLLKEINSYRASIHLDSLDEVKELSAVEQELADRFRVAGKTVLSESEGDEALDSWRSKTKDWSYCDDFGPGWGHDKDGNYSYILFDNAKVPANTPEGNAELRTTLGSSGAFNCKDCKSIGIAVVTIDGQMYWSCCTYN